MQLVADRFVVDQDGRAIDLATGARITLRIGTAGGASDQMRWMLRCDALHATRHRALAPLVDFGPLGESQRFEAWACGDRWNGARAEARRVYDAGIDFLRACWWTRGSLSVDDVRQAGTRAFVLPDAGTGYPEEGEDEAGPPCDAPAIVRGLCIKPSASVATLGEMFDAPPGGRSHVAALVGAAGSGKRTATMTLARIARARGFVPIGSRFVTGGDADLWSGRSLFIIADAVDPDAWNSFLQAALRSPVPHVLLLVCVDEVPGVAGITLKQWGADDLRALVYPRVATAAIDRQLRRAARRARGLPGRFARLLSVDNGSDANGTPKRPSREAVSRVLKAAEQPARYGVTEPPPVAPLPHPSSAAQSWPAPGELAQLRRRMDSAIALIDRGRHEPGVRQLRQVVGGFARRDDWSDAAEGAIALGAALLRRGRAREAQTVLAEAREHATRGGRESTLADVAVLSGEAWIDLARLDEAETVLAAAVAAARGLRDAGRVAAASLTLARCLFWRGRYAEAAAAIAPAIEDVPSRTRTRRELLAARIAVGRRDVGAGMTLVSGALARARTEGHASDVASAAYCAALAHLAVGDADAVQQDVAEAVAAARDAHDPLRALRARLVLAAAECLRGRRAAASLLLRRLRRAGASLPPLVRVRCELLSDVAANPIDEARETARRHIAASGVGALELFVAGRAAPHASAGDTDLVAGVVDIVRTCQAAEDDAIVLRNVCARVRAQIHAAAVAYVHGGAESCDALASDGARIGPTIGPRAIAAGVTIAPHRHDDRIEAAAPVQYGGTTLGALCARWVVGQTYDLSRAAAVLEAATAASAPIVASALSRRERASPPGGSAIIGVTAVIRELRAGIDRAAAAPFPVLVEGESGSGKELVARAIHRASARRERTFCALNCAALPDDLIEAELFGHARGAFTGAMAERAGVFEEAHGGTLFLDEIGELSPRAQAKVLRVLQDGELRRVGENLPRRIDVGVVAATNRDLRHEVEAGRFRLDLLYRLDVVRLTVPPLRERREDIAMLAAHFWQEATHRVGSRAALGAATLGALSRYDWPGNVRELQNVLAALAVRAPKRGVVAPAALPPQFAATPAETWRLTDARRTFEEQFIRAALVRSGGHRGRAADELGLTRQGLTKLMTRLGIPAEDEMAAADG